MGRIVSRVTTFLPDRLSKRFVRELLRSLRSPVLYSPSAWRTGYTRRGIHETCVQGLIVLGLAFALGVFALAQLPQGKGKKGDKEKGPKGFQLGKVLPPFIVDELELTPAQEAKIAALEKEVRAKLEKILTAKQKRLIQNARPPRKGKDDDKKDKKDKDDDVRIDKPAGGIQWLRPSRARGRKRSAPAGRSCWSPPRRTARAYRASGDRASKTWTGVSCPGLR